MNELWKYAQQNKLNDIKQRISEHGRGIIDTEKDEATGATALIYASRHGSLPIIQFLIRSGANPNITDNDGNTPLHWVCRCPISLDVPTTNNIINTLIANGADPTLTNKENLTPAQCAPNNKIRCKAIEEAVKSEQDGTNRVSVCVCMPIYNLLYYFYTLFCHCLILFFL